MLLKGVRATSDMGRFCYICIRRIKLTIPVHFSVDLLRSCCRDEPDKTDEDADDPEGKEAT